MTQTLRPALSLLAAFTVVTGVLYPLSVTLLATSLWPQTADGSLVRIDGRTVGSELIGQPFAGANFFHGRPSATVAHACDASASSGSNLGPANPALHAAVASRVDALRRLHPTQAGPVPVDLVTTSASGLDPHISPAAALYQVDRVAAARGLAVPVVRRLVDEHVEERTFGVLGERRVNVLRLNLALAELARDSGLR